MSWRQTIAKKPTWKDSIMRSKPITPEEMKADVIRFLMPEIKEKTSWKNTLSIKPVNGRDGKDGKSIKGPKGDAGKDGKDGQSIVGPSGLDGVNGINGTNGSKILFLDSKPTDEGSDGDLVLINKTFEVFYKENGEWIKKGTLLGKEGKVNYIGGPAGASAYDIAVKYGFSGTEIQWLDSLGGSMANYKEHVDYVDATVTYIGQANPGSSDSAAAWRIKKITTTGEDIDITFADGNINFDNVWTDRTLLSYS